MLTFKAVGILLASLMAAVIVAALITTFLAFRLLDKRSLNPRQQRTPHAETRRRHRPF